MLKRGGSVPAKRDKRQGCKGGQVRVQVNLVL